MLVSCGIFVVLVLLDSDRVIGVFLLDFPSDYLLDYDFLIVVEMLRCV